MADNLLDWFSEQNRVSNLQKFAAQTYGADSPQVALAQGAPDQFAKFLSDQSSKQAETGAIQQYYNAGPTTAQTNAQPLPDDSQSGNLASQAISQAIMPPPTALQRMTASMANLPPALQATAASQMQFQNPSGDGTQLSGPDLLKTLPPAMAARIEGINSGKQPLTAREQSSAAFQPLINALMMVHPDYDAADAQARQKARNDITSGPGSKKLQSISTAINTLQQADAASQKYGDAFGSDWGGPMIGLMNTGRAMYHSASNDPALVTYNQLAKTAADETTNAVTTGGGTGADRETRYDIFKAGQSQAARHAAFVSAIQELKARVEPIAESYGNAMHTSVSPIQLISPEAQGAYTKITGEQAPVTSVSGLTGDITPAPQSASAPAASPSSAPADSRGTVSKSKYSKATILAGLKARGIPHK